MRKNCTVMVSPPAIPPPTISAMTGDGVSSLFSRFIRADWSRVALLLRTGPAYIYSGGLDQPLSLCQHSLLREGSRPDTAVTMPTGMMKMTVRIGAIMTTAGDTGV